MIELTPDILQRIEAHVATGSFKGPSDVVQAALDMLKERQREYAQLTEAIEQAKRGEVVEFDVEDTIRRGRHRLSRQVRHLPYLSRIPGDSAAFVAPSSSGPETKKPPPRCDPAGVCAL